MTSQRTRASAAPTGAHWFVFLAACGTLALVYAATVGAATAAEPRQLRIATFNISLVGQRAGEMAEALRERTDPKAQALAEIIQRVDPDILLLNEIDYDAGGTLLQRFQTNYLEVGQNFSKSPQGAAHPIHFPHRFLAPVNTGVASAHDLDGNGKTGSPEGTPEYAGDAQGYGLYPGQYGMALLSKHPITAQRVRTFQKFLWKDMPAALLPDRAETPAPADWYSAAALAVVRLSSKSHWDVPVRVGNCTLHVLASHPTPPVFDGPEDRNGRRNHDEIRFWSDYLAPEKADYLYDDQGARGGLPPGERFVIVGDLNADPHDGSPLKPIALLLGHPRINGTINPRSTGAVEASQTGINPRHRGDPALDTGDFPDEGDGPGNLRTDYVLPAKELRATASGVFWPKSQEPLFPLVDRFPFASSDHRLVWVDVLVP